MSTTAEAVTEAAVFRKIGARLLPILCLGYLFNYMDRTNIGFAALGMNKAIGLSASQFGLGAGILFLAYSGFEVPSNIALHRFGARLWLGRIMITWGFVSAAMALVTGPNSFYGMRLALGLAEAGFFPGVTFYLASWFPAQYRARILAWFLVAIPASSVIAGPISGALLQMEGFGGLAGWQWLFVIEGLPCVLIGVAVLFILSDRPATATWLTPDERAIAERALAAEARDRPVGGLWAALSDKRVLLLAAVQFGFTAGSYGVQIWLPQIIKAHQFSDWIVGMLSAIPYLVASVAMIVWAASVDRSGRKISNLVIACLLATVGLVLSVVVSGSFIVALLGLTVAVAGVTSARAIFWTIPTRFLTGIAAAGGLAFINSIGTAGGFAGPAAMGWLKDYTGGYTGGLLAMAALLAVTTGAAWALRFVIRTE